MVDLDIVLSGASTAELEKELLAMSGQANLSDALKYLRLVEPGQRGQVLIDSEKWTRGGAETYIQYLTLHAGGVSHRLVLKACTPSVSSKPIEGIFGEWIERRGRIEAAGIAVPHLFGIGKAILLEAFIPFRALDLLQTGSHPDLFYELGLLAGRLERLGFRPIRIAGDLRSLGDDLVMIDFGSDLGGTSSDQDMQSVETLRDRLVKELTGLRIPEDRIDVKRIEGGLNAALNETLSTYSSAARH